MEESIILNILYKLKWLITRNRTFEMKRLIKQELNNLKGITEKTCKLIKIRKEIFTTLQLEWVSWRGISA